MENLKGSIKLVLVFLIVALLVIFVLLLAPDSLKLPLPSEVYPK